VRKLGNQLGDGGGVTGEREGKWMAALVKRQRNGDGGYDGQRPAIEELKTIDGDYGGSCYDRN
jgi:hypothetical protein